MKSDVIKKGIERAPHRSLLHAVGCTRSDFSKPFIGIINSFSEIVPGHTHLDRISAAVKKGIRARGGVPFEVNTIAVCDGIAMGHSGMKYSLPSRELIADSVEVVVSAHAFDGLVFVPNCDKVIPGMLMAAARLDLPSIFVSGGPMLAGRDTNGNPLDLNSVFLAVGKYATGQINQRELTALEQLACPGCGSCSGMFTANTMNCLTEVLGMALPGNGTVPASTSRRLKLAVQAGERIMGLVAAKLIPSAVITKKAIRNAFTIDMAFGGSTNSVLHLIAIGHEAGLEFPLEEINQISLRTPYICKLAPAGHYHVEDLDRAGGVPAIMAELRSKLDIKAKTVTGTLDETIGSAKVRDPDVIRSPLKPYSATGGLAVLFGNLAPDGAVVKAGAVAPEMLKHQGPARVFDSEELATQAITGGRIKPGDVVVIRYEGPKGGPGMREMLSPTSLLSGMGLDSQVALITDGRFSGASKGAAIGHISPEAASHGPIAALKEGDIIEIDIPGRGLNVRLSDTKLKQRLGSIAAFKPRVSSGYLKRYADKVTSASTGAVFSK